MKKVIALFVVIICLTLSISASAFYTLPSGIEYASLDDIPAPLSDFNGGKKVQGPAIYSSHPTNDKEFIVYEGNLRVSLPYAILTELDFKQNGEITYSLTYEDNETYTYEEELLKTIGLTTGYEIGYKLNIPLLALSNTLNPEISDSLSSEISKTTSFSYTKGQTIASTEFINEPGYYRFERRGIFKCYIIQERATIYDVKYINKEYVRQGGKRYFLIKNTLKFVYDGISYIGLVKYNYENNRLIPDVSYNNPGGNLLFL